MSAANISIASGNYNSLPVNGGINFIYSNVPLQTLVSGVETNILDPISLKTGTYAVFIGLGYKGDGTTNISSLRLITKGNVFVSSQSDILVNTTLPNNSQFSYNALQDFIILTSTNPNNNNISVSVKCSFTGTPLDVSGYIRLAKIA